VIVFEADQQVVEGVEEVAPPLTTLGSLHFSQGLLGFETLRKAELISLADAGPFCWLKFEGPDERGFLVVKPSSVVGPYRIEIGAKECESLGLQRPSEAEVLNIVTLHPNGTMTINLKGPLVFHRTTREACQVVPLNASELPVNYPINN